MKQHFQGLGPLATQFFAYVQNQGKRKVYTGDIQRALGLSTKQERELLSRLSRKGLIIRLKKTVYLIPEKIPPGGKWMPGEYVLVNQLMNSMGARYFISGPTAFQYYGLQSQVPNIVTVYNDKISGKRVIGGQQIDLIKTSTKRIAGWQKIVLSRSETAKIATLPRAIMDAVYDWKRFNTLPQAYGWIESIIDDKKLLKDFVQLVRRYSNTGTIRRIGFVLESKGASSNIIKKLKQVTPKSKGWIPLDPNKPLQGKTNKKWGVIINGTINTPS